MSKAGEALTDVRRWLCDNLSDGEAGKVCGMLSVVSRHINELDDENAKMREELAKARDPQRIGGQADPNSFVYAIEQLREFRWQHATNDEDAIPYINNVAAAHECENAKLRDSLQDFYDVACAFYRGTGTEDDLRDLSRQMRELGVGVD